MSKLLAKRRILIVGEGRETEYNYFVGFRNAFKERLQATATSVAVARGKGGNARQIVKNAIYEAKKFQPLPRRGDRVFLLLDTEGLGRAPELQAAEQLAQKHKIRIIYSSPAFEYWLLCHFVKVPQAYFADCHAVIAALQKKWPNVCNDAYNKADRDVFPRLAKNFGLACEQALQIDLCHLQSSASAYGANPSTQVYELIAFLIGAESNGKCPITGNWEVLGNPSIKIQLRKGAVIPAPDGKPAWYCPDYDAP